MLTEVLLYEISGGARDLGSRPFAVPIRRKIESAIGNGDRVVVDFDGVEATQSFVDELIGVLVLERGPEVLSSISFRKCSSTVKAIVSFVVSDRAQQFKAPTRGASPSLHRAYA